MLNPHNLTQVILTEGTLMLVNIVGFLACFTSTISLIPQIIKMFKTRSVDDLSTGMIINFLLSSIFWILYGYLIISWSVLLTNIFMLILAITMAFLKIKYSNNKFLNKHV